MGNPDPPDGPGAARKVTTIEDYQGLAEIEAADRESWAFDKFAALQELDRED